LRLPKLQCIWKKSQLQSKRLNNCNSGWIFSLFFWFRLEIINVGTGTSSFWYVLSLWKATDDSSLYQASYVVYGQLPISFCDFFFRKSTLFRIRIQRLAMRVCERSHEWWERRLRLAKGPVVPRIHESARGDVIVWSQSFVWGFVKSYFENERGRGVWPWKENVFTSEWKLPKMLIVDVEALFELTVSGKLQEQKWATRTWMQLDTCKSKRHDAWPSDIGLITRVILCKECCAACLERSKDASPTTSVWASIAMPVVARPMILRITQCMVDRCGERVIRLTRKLWR